MGFLDNLLGKKAHHNDWEVTHQGILRDLSYADITAVLGNPQKAKGRFVYWRGPLTDLDPDYPEGDYFQLSNKDFRGFGDAAKEPKIDRENWFVLATSENAIRLVSNEVGGLARDIESV